MKEKKTKTSDVITWRHKNKDCCLRNVEKSKTFISNSIKSKNWLLVYHLPVNAKKCLGYF